MMLYRKIRLIMGNIKMEIKYINKLSFKQFQDYLN